MCLHELSIINDTLEALDAPKKYQWLHNSIIRIIIGLTIYIFYNFAIKFYDFGEIHHWKFYKNLTKGIYIIFFTSFPTFAINLNILLCGTVLELVYM